MKNEKNAKISVIVPYKNAEQWIGKCAESLKAQKGDFEFIMVDDHSTDDGYDKLRAITEDDDRFLRIGESSDEGHGVSWARNFGLECATGDWITFLDADDYWLPEAGKTLRSMMETGASVIQANHLRHYTKTGATKQKFYVDAGTRHLWSLPICWFAVWNKLYRREAIEGIRFNEDLQFGEDELFNMEVVARTRGMDCVAGSLLMHVFQNPNSLAKSKTDIDLLKQIRALVDFMEEHPDPEIRRLIFDILKSHMDTAWYFDIITGGAA